ncbi:hypothetical protein NHX12_013727 [Muraenolepis orangiensis]|uniref:DNA polymerase nu n=1 Tax=Muraenolepis orangiensis TaxID=630683 RepID=A0A9Q0DA06_9TELE|nr:hypothetical protein NHX12_013727 [Muraenolepis orangiensis]
MESYGAISHSLYHGPLSQPAERVLAALRAQTQTSRNSHSNHQRTSQPTDRAYGSQRENSMQGDWRRMQDRENERHIALQTQTPSVVPPVRDGSAFRAKATTSPRDACLTPTAGTYRLPAEASHPHQEAWSSRLQKDLRMGLAYRPGKTLTPGRGSQNNQNQIQPRGTSAGSWAGRQNHHTDAVPPKNQHKVHLPRLNPVKVASTGGDQMDTASDYDVDDADLRQTKNQRLAEGFPGELGTNGEGIAAERYSRSIGPEWTPVPVDGEGVTVVTPCPVETPQETAESETPGDTEETPPRPKEPNKPTQGGPHLDRAAAVCEQDATGGDGRVGRDTAVEAEVVLETDERGAEGTSKTPAEEQMEMLEDEEEASHKDNSSPAMDHAPVTPSTSGPNVGSDAGRLGGESSELPPCCPAPPKPSQIPAFTAKRKREVQTRASPAPHAPQIPVPRLPVRTRVGRTHGQAVPRRQPIARGSTITHPEMKTSHTGDPGTVGASGASGATSKAPRQKQAKRRPGKTPHPGAPSAQSGGDARREPPAGQTAGVTSDPGVKDVGRMSSEERAGLLRAVGQARATALTMVYQDGSTQLDPEQNPIPPVCGLLVLLKRELDPSGPGPHQQHHQHLQDTCFYLKLDHTPTWAQHHAQETLLQVVSGTGLLVCYKAKDLLRTALQHYRPQLSWKQVAGCRIQDPQVSGWLLDPADPAARYQDLLDNNPTTTSYFKAVASLSLLYCLNVELRTKLQSQGLWQLYATLELSMIPVLAAMESHRIHVDREALKTTSDMLGTKMKQLEQEVLFDKLRLHDLCENKKLPKTINTQQQSTSEAALLLLRDLHPLPKIILEYRQVHKIKSTFVDGILSCMVGKSYISSTWCQTSAVTGRISAKHPVVTDKDDLLPPPYATPAVRDMPKVT